MIVATPTLSYYIHLLLIKYTHTHSVFESYYKIGYILYPKLMIAFKYRVMSAKAMQTATTLWPVRCDTSTS
jgi:hypothetical protein